MRTRATLTTELRRAGIDGVLDPGDPAVAAALAPFDTSIAYNPDVIVAARTSADVEAAVLVAQRHGVPVVALGTGHGMLADVAGGLLIATHTLAGVSVDVDARTARVTGGANWNAVLEAATPHGLAPLCGSAPAVGVISFLLGGGLGPISRQYGFSADHVRSIEIVTPADGAMVVTARERPDLFWALRGGKSGFGVVTAVTVDLFPIAEVYSGGLYFAADAARNVVLAVTEWAPSLPESETASLALLRLPASPTLPEPLRGRYVAHVRFVSTAELAHAESALAPIRGLATPLVDTVSLHPYAQIGAVHGDPVTPMPVMSGGATLREIPAAAIDAMLAVVGPDQDIPLSAVELRALGGAISSPAEVPNAVGGRDAAWNLFVSASPSPSSTIETRRAAVRSVIDTLGAWRSPVNLVNFIGRANDRQDVPASWTPDQRLRLAAIRSTADPDGILTSP